MRVFLCHASVDKTQAKDLHTELIKAGFNPWLDEANLLPGQDWALEIRRMLRNSGAVVVCMSCRSVQKTGYVQKEIKLALDIADEQPEGAIFVIPARLDKCQIPDRLQKWHWVDLFKPDGKSRLTEALKRRHRELEQQVENESEDSVELMVRQIVANFAGVSIDKIPENASFKRELGMDTVAKRLVISEIARKFGFNLTDESGSIRDTQAVVELVKMKQEKQDS